MAFIFKLKSSLITFACAVCSVKCIFNVFVAFDELFFNQNGFEPHTAPSYQTRLIFVKRCKKKISEF